MRNKYENHSLHEDFLKNMKNSLWEVGYSCIVTFPKWIGGSGLSKMAKNDYTIKLVLLYASMDRSISYMVC